jgi:outer membrane protein
MQKAGGISASFASAVAGLLLTLSGAANSPAADVTPLPSTLPSAPPVTSVPDQDRFLGAGDEPGSRLRILGAASAETSPASGPVRLPEEVPSPQPAVFTLDDAIRLAFAYNPDLQAAQQRIRIADAILLRARSEFYPQLGISEAYGLTNNPVNAFMFLLNQAQFSLGGDLNHPGGVDDFHTQFLLQHGVYTGGRREAETDAAAANRIATGCALATVQSELVFRVAEAYYRAFQARELVMVREQAVSQFQSHVGLVETRLRAGTAVRSDLSTVEVRLAEAQEALITAGNQQTVAWLVIQNVCGALVPQQNLPPRIPAGPWSGDVDEIEAAVATAMSERPEIAEMSHRMRAACDNIRVAEAGKRPSVQLVGDYDAFTGDFRQGNDSWFLGLVAQINLFDGARTANDIRKAKEQVAELRARQQRLLLDIELDVKRAYLQLDDARQRLAVAARTIDQAGESLRETEVRYRGQAVTITQLIDAQVALSGARVRCVSAMVEVEIARAALEQATGRVRDLLRRGS